MENFSIRIDENVRLRLYKICRLCGDDNPNNTDILANNKKSTNVDPDFHKKIFDCVGIQVTKGDKMPQTACNSCREKINDFFDFREMCLATDIQTRRLLGLTETIVPKLDPVPDAIEDDKTEVEKTIKKKNQTATKAVNSAKTVHSTKSIKSSKVVKVEKKAPPDIKKPVKVERDKPMSKVKKKVQTNPEPPVEVRKKLKVDPERILKAKKRKASGDLLTEKTPNKRERLRETIIRKFKNPNIALDEAATNVSCTICNNAYLNAGELHRHLDTDHLPKVVSYHCVRCNESIEKKQDVKDHNLWHKLSKTPFECGRCGKSIMSLSVYTKHILNCSVFVQDFEYKTKKCATCNEEFETQNLYNWHKCVISQLKCEVCQMKFTKRATMLRHVVRCSAIGLSTSLPVVDSALEPEPEPAPEPEPEPEIEDHFADAASNDEDGSDAEMNFKPNLEIDIEVPAKERIAGDKRLTPFVVIPHGVTNTDNSRQDLNSASNSSAGTPATSNSASLQGGDDDSISTSNPTISITPTPMVRIKLEPRLNRCEPSKDSNDNAMNSEVLARPGSIPTNISVRIKSEIIDSEYRGLLDSEISSNIKKERGTQATVRLCPSQDQSAEVTLDPLAVPDAVEVSSPKPTPKPAAKPALKLVIKKQHGTLNSSFVDGIDIPREVGEPEAKKKKKKKSKIFKIPKALALRIKQERCDNDASESNKAASESNNLASDLREVVDTSGSLPVISEVCSRSPESKKRKNEKVHKNSLNPAISIKQERLDSDDESMNAMAGPVVMEVVHKTSGMNMVDVNHVNQIKQERLDDAEYGSNLTNNDSTEINETRRSGSSVVTSICSKPRKANLRKVKIRNSVNPMNLSITIKQEKLDNHECEPDVSRMLEDPLAITNEMLSITDQACSKSASVSVSPKPSVKVVKEITLNTIISIKQERLDPVECESNLETVSKMTESLPSEDISQICSKFANSDESSNLYDIPPNPTISIKVEGGISPEATPSKRLPIISRVCSNSANSSIERRADDDRIDVDSLNRTMPIKQERLESNECESAEIRLSKDAEKATNTALPVISQVCSKSTESNVQSIDPDTEEVKALDPTIAIKQERVDIDECDQDVVSADPVPVSSGPLPIISQVCSQSMNEADADPTISIKQERFDNDECESETDTGVVDIRLASDEVVPVISDVCSSEVNKTTTPTILPVRIKTERFYEDEEEEDNNREVVGESMENDIRIKQDPDSHACVSEQDTLLAAIYNDTQSNTELSHDSGHNIDRSDKENLMLTEPGQSADAFALKISFVSSGKDALAEIESGERTSIKKDFPPVGKTEPRRFPMLRIRSEFNAFNFSDDNISDPPAPSCSAVVNESPRFSVQIKSESGAEVPTGVGPGCNIPIKGELQDYETSIKSEPCFEGEYFRTGNSDADVLFHNSLDAIRSESVNNFVISSVESIGRAENLVNDQNPKEEETDLLVEMEHRNFDDRISSPLQQFEEVQSPAGDDEQNKSFDDEAQQFVVCKEEPRYESDNEERDYISDSQSVVNEDDVTNGGIEKNLDEIGPCRDSSTESTHETAGSVKHEKKMDENGLCRDTLTESSHETMGSLENVAGCSEDMFGSNPSPATECLPISLDRINPGCEYGSKANSSDCEQRTNNKEQEAVDNLANEQSKNSQKLKGSHMVSPIYTLHTKAIFNEISPQSDQEPYSSSNQKSFVLSEENNPISEMEKYPVENAAPEKETGIQAETNTERCELENVTPGGTESALAPSKDEYSSCGEAEIITQQIEPAPVPSKDEYSSCAELKINTQQTEPAPVQSKDEYSSCAEAKIITHQDTNHYQSDSCTLAKDSISVEAMDLAADSIEPSQDQTISGSTENTDDGSSDFEDNFDENISGESDSNCNQKLKDLIKDNDNLLGFFENELSRNCDFSSGEPSPRKSSEMGKTTDSTSPRADPCCERSMSFESEEAKCLNEGTHETDALPLENDLNDCKADVHNISNEITEVAKDVKQQPDDQNYVLEAASECKDAKASSVGNRTDCTSVSPQRSSTVSSNICGTANAPIVSSSLRIASTGSLTTNGAVNIIGSSVPPSIGPAIISLPKAIVSPTVSGSVQSYKAPPSNPLNSAFLDPSTSTESAFNVRNIDPPIISIVGCSSVSSLNSNDAPPNYPNVIASVSSSNQSLSPPTQQLLRAYPNVLPGVSISNPPATPLNMLHINEIAENNNNANIERELRNDLDSISPNSNLDFDDGTVASLSEVSGNNIPASVNNKNNTAPNH